jgi:trans-aconitate methyltransferase
VTGEEPAGSGARRGLWQRHRDKFVVEIERNPPVAAALPDVHAGLAAGRARVLDLGCGQGWSSTALAEAFPGIRVDGVDLDEPSHLG